MKAGGNTADVGRTQVELHHDVLFVIGLARRTRLDVDQLWRARISKGSGAAKRCYRHVSMVQPSLTTRAIESVLADLDGDLDSTDVGHRAAGILGPAHRRAVVLEAERSVINPSLEVLMAEPASAFPLAPSSSLATEA